MADGVVAAAWELATRRRTRRELVAVLAPVAEPVRGFAVLLELPEADRIVATELLGWPATIVVIARHVGDGSQPPHVHPALGRRGEPRLAIQQIG